MNVRSHLNVKLSHSLLVNARGFTLIELLVVIVIVGILSAVSVPTFLNQVRRSRTAEALSALSSVSRASEIYRVDEGVYPIQYSDIRAGGPNGFFYMTEQFQDLAPNYQEPLPSGSAGTPAGITWSTTADSVANPAYVNGNGAALFCVVGIGADFAASTMASGCNL